MLTHRGFSAWIEVDGKPVPEYLVAKDSNIHRVSCWIPSEEGQTFSVYWKDHDGNIDTCSYITLDGFTVPGRFLFGTGVAWRAGVRSSQDGERPFMFQRIDDAGLSRSEGGTNEQGMITLKIKRVVRVVGKPADPLPTLQEASPGKRRAGDLKIGFGQEQKTFDQYAYTWSVKPHDEPGNTSQPPSTYVSFVFRYRSREFLQMQGIMPENAPVRKVVPNRASVRRIVSAPAVPVEKSSAYSMMPPPSTIPPFKRHKPTPIPHQMPSSTHRMYSEPQVTHMVPSTSTSRTPTALDSTPTPTPMVTPKPYPRPPQFLPMQAPHPHRPTADNRRTVSWRAPPKTPGVIPGEGVMQFDTPIQPPNHDIGEPTFGFDFTLSSNDYAVRNSPHHAMQGGS